MTTKNWQPIKVCFCQHMGMQVALEAEVMLPAEWLPDQPARLGAHRCSQAMSCNEDGRPSCIWAGTNPAIDPFSEII